MKKLLVAVLFLAFGGSMFYAGIAYANRNTIEYVRGADGRLVRK